MADDVIKTLIAEAYGEGPEGMRRVAETILNRAAIRGLTPEQVVRQPHQYTGLLHPGDSVRKLWDDPQAIAKARAALDLALQPGDPTGGADHYHTDKVNPSWNRSMPKTGQHGSHIYYASRHVPPGELPQVATQMDTRRVVPPSAPTPLPPMLAAQRNLQPLKPDVSAIYAGMYPQAAPKAPVSNQSLVFGRGIADTIERSQAGQDQALAAALQRSLSASQRPLSTAAISYAGQERQPKPKVTTIGTVSTKPKVSGAVSYAAQERGSTPAKRLAPPMPISVAQSYAGQERGQTPSVSRTATLPAIPPSNSVVPRHFDVTLARAAAAQDPVLTAALAKPSVAAPMTTAQLRDDNGQGQRSFRPAAVAPPTTVASYIKQPAIPGPAMPPKIGAERLVAGTWGVPEIIPPEDLGVGTQLSVVPNVALPRPRPAVASVQFPTPATFRPQTFGAPITTTANVALPRLRPVVAAPVARPTVAMPTSVARRPVAAAKPVFAMPTPNTLRPGTPGALNVVVQGAGTIQPSGGSKGGSSGSSSSPQYVSASTGERLYATQTKHYNPDTNSFEKVTTYTPRR